MRLGGGAVLLALALAVACGSSSKDAEAPLALKEIGRQEIGPAGGTVVGGAVTIEIPEGALTAPRTIIINEADPNARQLPAETQIAGGLYVLQPDDVTFLKPVTVKVQLDAAKKRADGKGAIVLFRGTAANTTWQPYGADDSTATVITGRTTHFSLWAPTAAAETHCYLKQCNGFARFGPKGEPVDRNGQPLGPAPEPTTKGNPTQEQFLPGLDCTVPNNATDKGVVCTGSGERNGPPYECHCLGSDVSLGTWQRLPADTTVSAMALQCGAPACPAQAELSCNLGWECSGNSCFSAREPRILCNAAGGGAPSTGTSGGTSGGSTPPPNPNGAWTCSCVNGGSFTLPSNNATNDEVVPLWQASCGGSCENASVDPNTEWVCPGPLTGDLPSGGCFTEPAGTCRDNHTYRVECDKGGADMATCKCMIDGAVTKQVQGLCIEGHFLCDWPRHQGGDDTRKCPRVVDGNLEPPPPGQAPTEPLGCFATTGGPCRDGHTYRVECPNANPVSGEPGPTECQCMVDGAPTKKVSLTRCYDEAPAACGWQL